MGGYRPHRFSGSQAWKTRQDRWRRRLLRTLEKGEELTIAEIRTRHKFPRLDASDDWLEKQLMALMKNGQVAQRVASDGVRWYIL